ncbi:hypothetical protein ACGTN6_15590 [Halomonas sp. THAF12]|uniref:hypothetical protein n=1 Tax=Halomonas sp. B23F22_10 TaxID=3459515 RepID=UPI00373E22C7
MKSDAERNMDTYLSSGIATDGTTQNLKELSERKHVPDAPVHTAPTSPDAVEGFFASIYFGIPRRVFFLLAVIGALIGFGLGLNDYFGLGVEKPQYITAGLGAALGYMLIPGIYIAIRLGWIAFKMALGFVFLYLIWTYVIYPLMLG